jgi:predicted Zn-dependent protease
MRGIGETVAKVGGPELEGRAMRIFSSAPRASPSPYAAAIWLVACLHVAVPAAHAQQLSAPSDVVLYVHSDMKRTEFVERLECALKHILVAPVSTRELKLVLGADLRASPTQLDTQKTVGTFVRATANEGGPLTFKYLVLPFDLKEGQLPFVWNSSFTDTRSSVHVGIVSTARLDPPSPVYPNEQNSARTVHRLYKLILRSMARLVGLKGSNACVLARVRTLDELDRQPADFCPDDRTALVDAGILKSEQNVGVGCALMSSGSTPSLHLVASKR